MVCKVIGIYMHQQVKIKIKIIVSPVSTFCYRNQVLSSTQRYMSCLHYFSCCFPFIVSAHHYKHNNAFSAITSMASFFLIKLNYCLRFNPYCLRFNPYHLSIAISFVTCPPLPFTLQEIRCLFFLISMLV
jgi:hypothetical protein